ncbi:hypothetical protein [Acidisphaera sp. L21]|uniref:hypothetical protein n=1 Tax=Acidisphaera sp. L21 TaxID=1641851 RepID=UPI00131BAC88|nr:hypothetical protein [Acidisphaera sp. L21]
MRYAQMPEPVVPPGTPPPPGQPPLEHPDGSPIDLPPVMPDPDEDPPPPLRMRQQRQGFVEAYFESGSAPFVQPME